MGGGKPLYKPDDQPRLFEGFKDQFLGGYFINWRSTLYFAGKTEDLNRMLDELSRTARARVAARFSSEPNDLPRPMSGMNIAIKGKQGGAHWRLTHDGGTGFGITVYLVKGGVDLTKLRLPEFVGEAPSVKKAEFKFEK